MTDNGLAALAAALDQVIDDGFYYDDLYKTRPAEDATAILGERGVFLADGLPDYNIAYAAGVEDGKGEQAAEITRLRAALDGLVEAAGAVLASNALDPDEFLALDRGILAALAAARPDPRGRGHDHSAAQRNRVPHEDEAVSVSESRP